MLIAFRSDRISVETSKRRTSNVERRNVETSDDAHVGSRDSTEGQKDRFSEGQNRKTTATLRAIVAN